MTKTSKVSLDEAIAESEKENHDFAKAFAKTKGMTLYVGEPLYTADVAKLDEVTENVLWRADISGVGGKVNFHKIHVTKETPCGYWTDEPYRFRPVWRSKDSKKASKTRREALDHLYARKRSYVGHSKRRLKTAEGQLRIAKLAWESLQGDSDE